MLGLNLTSDVTPAIFAWINLAEHEGVLDIVSENVKLEVGLREDNILALIVSDGEIYRHLDLVGNLRLDDDFEDDWSVHGILSPLFMNNVIRVDLGTSGFSFFPQFFDPVGHVVDVHEVRALPLLLRHTKIEFALWI